MYFISQKYNTTGMDKEFHLFKKSLDIFLLIISKFEFYIPFFVVYKFYNIITLNLVFIQFFSVNSTKSVQVNYSIINLLLFRNGSCVKYTDP